MRQDKDRSAKWLLTHHGDAVLRLGGITGFVNWKPVQPETVAPRRLPDGLLEIQFPGEPTTTLVLVEIETYPNPDADRQVFEDLMLIALDRKVVPEVVSLVLKPKGNLTVTGIAERRSTSGRTQLHGTWPVVRLWEQNAEDLFAIGDVGLIPWVPLTRSSEPPDVLMARCRDRIVSESSGADRAGLEAVTQILASLAFPNRRFFDLFGGPTAMIESPLMEELKQELERKVRKDLESQMLLRGKTSGAQESILESLEARFGSVPNDVRDTISNIADLSRLRALLRLAATCPDLSTFAAAIV